MTGLGRIVGNLNESLLSTTFSSVFLVVIRIFSWVLWPSRLDTFQVALSLGVLYAGNNLTIMISLALMTNIQILATLKIMVTYSTCTQFMDDVDQPLKYKAPKLW